MLYVNYISILKKNKVQNEVHSFQNEAVNGWESLIKRILSAEQNPNLLPGEGEWNFPYSTKNWFKKWSVEFIQSMFPSYGCVKLLECWLLKSKFRLIKEASAYPHTTLTYKYIKYVHTHILPTLTGKGLARVWKETYVSAVAIRG